MSFAWLPCVLMLLPTAQDGSLELINHRRTYGYLGAPRPKDGTIPGDTVFFTFEIKNLKLDEAGKAAYSIAIELPGLDEKDIKVQVADDVLTIAGEKKVERTDEKTHYSERSYGSFTRAFTLPADADTNAIAARFAKGVLTLEIGKTATPSAKVKQVDVKPA